MKSQLAVATSTVADFHGLQDDTRGFSQLAELLKQRTGINLAPNSKNHTLMATRLNAIFRNNGFGSYDEYYNAIQVNPALMQEFIQALTTNTTHFFREERHFQILTQLLQQEIYPSLRDNENRELRLWCSATSTGQEVYTILFHLFEAAGSQQLGPGTFPYRTRTKFLATDIDLKVLEKASRGVYSNSDIETIPPDIRHRYFRKLKDGSRSVVIPELRQLVRFAPFNLMEAQYPFKHPFDIVFCRNVLIYFDAVTTAQVIDKIAQTLRPGGYLFLGHSESGMVRSKYLDPVSSAVYRRR